MSSRKTSADWGRNYLQTGHLIEDFFPRNGVRYIAMNDGIDTLRDNNDIAPPFKNILNEMYSKDISKKVHSSYLLKAQKGQFTGCLAPPFGYRKDPEDKNHLLIDEETAPPIVRLIFGYALNGHGPNYIRRRLEEEKIPLPPHGGTGNGGGFAIPAPNGKRKTRKTGGICGTSPLSKTF